MTQIVEEECPLRHLEQEMSAKESAYIQSHISSI